MSKVNVLFSEVRHSEVDVLTVFSNRHREFHKLCDIPALVAGSVGVIDWNGN